MKRLFAPFFGSACLLLAAAAAVAQTAAPASPSPRQRLRMDADWRFKLGAVHAAGTPVTGWRWKTLEQAPGPDVVAALAAPSDAKALGADWLAAEAGADVFHGRVGFALFIATIPAASPASAEPPVIHFEGVDDNAKVYLNGQQVADHQGWEEAFDVETGGVWKKDGSNSLAVVVENTAGAGGITRPVTLRAPAAPAAAEVAPGFDDKGWRTVQLPHDYVVEGPFDPKANGDHGFRPTPPAWYRKTFTVPADWKDKSVWIDFDGAFSDLHVWLNGQPLGTNRSGYIGARFDIGKLAKFGEQNVLAVHVDPSRFEGWWYEGGGIYRHVWLNASNKVHFKPDSIFVHPELDEPGSDGRVDANARMDFTLVNDSSADAAFDVDYEIIAPDGKVVLKSHLDTSGTTLIRPGSEIGSSSATYLKDVKLWSLEQPNLYRARFTAMRRSEMLDVAEVTFGFRSIRFDEDKGFFLNGKPVKIQGVCNHQDFAGVGVGLPDGLFDWRVKKLKEFGCNAWRTSHNPPAPELLEACDRLGMLVMDETRHLGDTYSGKTPRGTKADDLGDLEKMIRRDRNHPSVIMWSIENEEPLQYSAEGAAIARKMKERINALDGTRPITAAMNNGNLDADGITSVVDVEGFNYNPGRYDPFHAKFPKIPAHGSEITSAVTTRGEYARTEFKNGMGHFFGDPKKGYVAAYDINAPNWAQTTEYAWKMLAEREFMAGGFVWTGFDYRGEPTPYVWPCVNSHFGFLDMCGFPKDDAFYYVAWWKKEPMAHVFPHWNWPADKGEVNVWVYSNGEEAELLLNGKSLGTKKVPRWGHVEWQVTYAPGKLEARSLRDGKTIATDTVETAGPAAGLKLDGERTEVLADREDIGLVAVTVVDAQGRPVPTADNPVTFEVSGPGAVAGTGNGDPISHDPEQTKERRAFNGKAMVLVRATAEPGDIAVTASAPGLKPATLTLRSKASDAKDAQ